MNKGERIKTLREEKQLSQVELAEKIGTTKQNIYKYENNIITNIPSDKIELMAKIFDVTPSYLMCWTNDKKSTSVDADTSALLSHLQQKYSDDELELLSSLNRNQAVEIVKEAMNKKDLT